MRIPYGTMALGGATLLAGLAVVAYVLPSDDFLYVPNKAQPVAENVTIEGTPDPSDAKGGIYTIDVTVRQANWAERYLPFLRPDGSSLVSGHVVTARGETFEKRRARSLAEMSRSEEIASAVALQAAGLDVRAIPRGALVTTVAGDVPAANVLEDGDVIVSAAGKPTPTPGALRSAVGTVRPGEPVTLRFRRGGKVVTATVKTVPAPDDARRPIIGIGVGQDAKIVLPKKVDIGLGETGGPSAGLPFALQVLQELGTDVDRGYRVAATGEIELDGAVGPVGGLKQKTLGVRKADVDVFLVPAGENAAVARRYAGNIRVIPVESFQQALHALQTLPQK